MRGTIRIVKLDEGYGFIHGADGIDYFFHRTGLQQTTRPFRQLEQRLEVEFTGIEAEKGPRAIEVRIIR